MDIITEKQNLLSLWVESFVVINQCFGKLVKAILGLLILIALVGAACAYTIGLSSQITQIVLNVLNIFSMTVLLQVIAAHILKSQQPLMEAFAGSVWPTLFQLVASFLLALACIPAGLICVPAMMLSPILGFIIIVALMFLFVRFLYVFIAIAVDNKGPIEGIVFSWKLTGGKNYIDVLLTLLLLIASYILIVLLFILLGLVLRIIIPLYFANSFDLTHLSPIWWIIGGILVILYLFYHLAMLTFLLLVFLNRKFQLEPLHPTKEQDPIFIPLPDLENTNQESVQQPPLTPEIPQDAPHIQDVQKKASSQEGIPAQSSKMETIGLTKTSVNTTEEDTNDITQHLHQVYTPRTKEDIQHTEEDRMPTILFDDDLAKQLEHQFLEEHQQQTPKNTSEDSSGDDSIQLSK